jgi:hypothetical protein
MTTLRLREPAVAVALSNDGDRLAAASAKAEIYYWDAHGAQQP